MNYIQGRWKKVRGATVVLKVDPGIDADNILRLAVDKHCTCDCQLLKDETYRLLYPDGRLVDYLPGTLDRFTLFGYKQFISKPYQKLLLYICSDDDYKSGCTIITLLFCAC